MGQAGRDQNSVPTLLALSSADGVTPVAVYADPTTHRLLVQNSGASTPGGSDTQVQFNDAGVLNGDAGLTYNKTTDTLTTGILLAVTSAKPSVSDGAALGSTSLMWSDLFLASGAVINFNNGDITLTHSADTLTLGGGDLALGANNITMTGSLGATGARLTKGWFTDLQVTNAISGSITGNAATVTTNANLTGPITSVGNATSVAAQTGTGSTFVMQASPSLTTPDIGAATATSVNKVTITAPASSATLTLADGSALVTSGANSITLTSSGATNVTLPTTGTLATLAGSETLSGKTLTAPKFANAGFIADANGNEIIIFTTTASAVNEITLANGATGVGPTFTASGETNVDINFQVKGTGVYNLKATASGPTDLRLFEDTDNGTSYVSLIAPASMGSNFVLTLPGATDTLVGKATTDTLTNKRVTPRVSTETSSATPTINTDNVDAHSITALAAAVTSMTTNLSGTPTNFQKLIVRFKDDGTGRGITWGASFEAKGVALPTTTTANKVLTVGFLYDTVTSKWGCVASANEA